MMPLCAALLLLAGPPQADPDPRALIEKAARSYRAITSFTADFKQVIADSMIGSYESRGRIVQAGESRLAMRFTDPGGDAIVMDGEHIWVYTPSTTPGQVLRLKLPTDPTYGPNVLAWILTDPARRYESRWLRNDQVAGRGADVVVLTPRDRSLPFREAVVWLDHFDNLPRKLEIRERGGQVRTLTFTGVQTGRRVGPETLAFRVPDGVRIVDQ